MFDKVHICLGCCDGLFCVVTKALGTTTTLGWFWALECGGGEGRYTRTAPHIVPHIVTQSHTHTCDAQEVLSYMSWVVLFSAALMCCGVQQLPNLCVSVLCQSMLRVCCPACGLSLSSSDWKSGSCWQ